MSELDAATVREIHDRWAAAQPPDAPVFGGPDGALHFADDEELWTAIAREVAKRRLLR